MIALSTVEIQNLYNNMMLECTSVPHAGDGAGRRAGVRIYKRWLCDKNGFSSFQRCIATLPVPTPGKAVKNIVLHRLNPKRGFFPDNVELRGDLLELTGNQLSIPDWAAASGMKYGTLMARLQRGWNVRDALTIAVEHREPPGSAPTPRPKMKDCPAPTVRRGKRRNEAGILKKAAAIQRSRDKQHDNVKTAKTTASSQTVPKPAKGNTLNLRKRRRQLTASSPKAKPQAAELLGRIQMLAVIALFELDHTFACR